MLHLTYEKRIRIQSLLYDSIHKYKQYEIAKIIGVSEGTISNELRRCKREMVLYDAKESHILAKSLRSKINNQIHSRTIKGTELEIYIINNIKSYWSPEQIAKTWNKAKEDNVSTDIIYNYIYGEHPERKKKYLRRKGKKYKHSNGDKIKIKNRISIDERPKEVHKNKKIGNYEGDTIVGINKSDCIITVIERKTNFLFAKVVHLKPGEKLSVVVSTIMGTMLSGIRKKLIKTLTLDNGTEFADHEYISLISGIDIYFAHPYHSRERGANENANGLLRQFLPKGSSFIGLSQEKLDSYVYLINIRPRKKLNWKSPMDVFRP